MKKKNVGLVLLSLVLIYVGYSYWSKVKKDKWAKERPEIKYSEARENEVWGGVLRGNDAGLFYGTPLYDLAKEMSGIIVYFRNQDKIERLISKLPKEYVNFQEEKYGTTIGHFALRTNNIIAIQKLLDKGLNPNLMDKGGKAIIININHFYYFPSEKLQALQHMIKKRANVNLYSDKAFNTPLMEASRSGDLMNVKILIKAGANPHFYKESYQENIDYTSYWSPLNTALTYGHINIVNYLIFEQKVDFRTLKYPSRSKFHPGEYQILHYLRDMPFELNTQDYRDKMKLVAYLKTQSLDYWTTPIPETISANSSYTKEYLSKY
jgi:hypothetical protein